MSWENIIRDYSSLHRPGIQREIDWLRRHSSFADVTISAAWAKTEGGARHSHQRLIRREAIPKAERVLLDKGGEIQRSRTSHQLWTVIKDALQPVFGIGPLYIYDASLRIGAYLNLLPDKVYLHAGTSKGARAHGLRARNKEWLEPDELPEALRRLPPHEVEDILCLYRHRAAVMNPCASPRARCYQPARSCN